MRTSLLRRAAVAVLAVTALATATACSSDDGPQTTDHPLVVASTDVWASVARAVGGEHADVTALYNSPDGDPHEFEPSAADTAKIQDGNVLLYNGEHYDAYFETAAADAKGKKINAYSILTGDESDGHDHDEDHAGHHHSTNEHVFYNLPVVAQVADKVADALAEVAPDHAKYYRDNAAKFTTGINGLRGRLAAIKAEHDGTKVTQTEPLAAYLLTEAGLVDVAPESFTAAVEEGQSPSAADLAKFQDLLTAKDGQPPVSKALIYNTQAVDATTESILKTARQSGVPVVQLTESLPRGVTDYLAWQSAQIQQLEQALDK
ncbi:MAG: zinc ABC transporter substrate-binding protein [Gordonia sp. (in: high G+C Gram-positive bacteria)]